MPLVPTLTPERLNDLLNRKVIEVGASATLVGRGECGLRPSWTDGNNYAVAEGGDRSSRSMVMGEKQGMHRGTRGWNPTHLWVFALQIWTKSWTRRTKSRCRSSSANRSEENDVARECRPREYEIVMRTDVPRDQAIQPAQEIADQHGWYLVVEFPDRGEHAMETWTWTQPE